MDGKKNKLNKYKQKLHVRLLLLSPFPPLLPRRTGHTHRGWTDTKSSDIKSTGSLLWQNRPQRRVFGSADVSHEFLLTNSKAVYLPLSVIKNRSRGLIFSAAVQHLAVSRASNLTHKYDTSKQPLMFVVCFFLIFLRCVVFRRGGLMWFWMMRQAQRVL